MEINIKITDQNNSLERAKATWNYTYRGNIRVVLIYLGLGLFFLIAGVTGKPGETALFTGLSAGTFWVVLVYIVGLVRNRSRYLAPVKMDISRNKRMKKISEITLDDVGVRIRNFEAYYELQWSLFSYYLLYKDYLLLFAQGSEAIHMAIGKKDLQGNEFDLLLRLVRSKMRMKA